MCFQMYLPTIIGNQMNQKRSMGMVKYLPSSVKWLLFTFISADLSFCLTGLSYITISAFFTGFIFSIAYLYRNSLENKDS